VGGAGHDRAGHSIKPKADENSLTRATALREATMRCAAVFFRIRKNRPVDAGDTL